VTPCPVKASECATKKSRSGVKSRMDQRTRAQLPLLPTLVRGTPCAHENACVRCPLLRVDPAQRRRLEEIHANLLDRLQEAREQGWLGEVSAIETTLAAAGQKLQAIREAATRGSTVSLGMPDVRQVIGRSTDATVSLEGASHEN
jgi:hypothetical protein